MRTFSSVLCLTGEDCLIKPEEFKYLKLFFRSVINWCCDTDGKSNVALGVTQGFFADNCGKTTQEVFSLPGRLFRGADVEP